MLLLKLGDLKVRRPLPRWHIPRVWLLWSLVALVSGCGTSVSPDSAPPAATPSHPATASSSDEPKEASAVSGPSEQHWWWITQVQGQVAGYVHMVRRVAGSQGEGLVHWEAEHFLWLERFGDLSTPSLRYWSRERPDGTVIRFGSQIALGAGAQQCRGHRQGEHFVMELQRQGQTVRQQLPAQGVRGFFALWQLLSQKPLRADQQIRFRQLHPVFLTVVEVELQGLGRQQVQIPQAPRELWAVKATVRIGQKELVQTLWLDDQGQLWRSQSEQSGVQEVNTLATREQVLALKKKPPRLDLSRQMVVRTTRPLPDARKLLQVRYQVEVPPELKLSLDQYEPWQQVRKLGSGKYEVVVRSSDQLRRDASSGPWPSPSDQYLRSSLLVDWNHPQVKRLAESVLPGEKDPWVLAAALEQTVAQRIAEKNFTLALASASEALQLGQGDCTEHAVLLAALARARGIPARLAYGVVYVPALKGFAFHMWTQLWIGGRWIPWDATQAWGQVGPDHIQLGHTPLNSPQDWTDLLPVVEVIGRIKITPVEVRLRQ